MLKLSLLLILAWVQSGHAQQKEDHVALGMAAYNAVEPEEALQHFETAIALDSSNYGLYCRAAEAAWDVGRIREGPHTEAAFAQMEAYARRAIAIAPAKPEGHALLAAAIAVSYLELYSYGQAKRPGLNSLNRSASASVQEAKRALGLDPNQALAHYILGRWERFWSNLAARETPEVNARRKWLGLSDTAAIASWSVGIHHLEQAVAHAPANIDYRFELASVYRGFVDPMGGGDPGVGNDRRPDDALAQFRVIDSLPVARATDSVTKASVKELLAALTP